MQFDPVFLGAGGEVFEGDAQAVFHVAAGQRDAAAELGPAVGFDPGVMLGPGGEAVFVDLGGEHLGER